MTSDDRQDQRDASYYFEQYWKFRWVFGIFSLLVGAFILVFFGLAVMNRPTAAIKASRNTVTTPIEDNLRDAREMLAREPDLSAAKAAVNKINFHLSQHPELRPADLTPEARKQMGQLYGLDAGELAEVESASFTTLDGHHLDECLLLRDAARSLDVEETGAEGKTIRPGPVDRAHTAFRWVVRQIRATELGQEQLPPAYALRRGWGDPLERSLAFLSLLAQDSGPERLTGCLLALPSKEKDKGERLWACGVVVGDGKDVYLFDPRLGIAIPGPKGEGIATLAAAVKDPTILSQLDAGSDRRYDVTAAQAATAEARLVYTVSELAPRIRLLEDMLTKGNLGVKLAGDPADLERCKAAMKASGAGGADVWKAGAGILRRFLPKEEGGEDEGRPFRLANLRGFTRPDDPLQVRMTRKTFFEWSLVPWEALPQVFNPVDFPIQVGLGQKVRAYFSLPFTMPVLDPKSAREQLLRGRPAKALPLLMTEDQQLHDSIARFAQEKNLGDRFGEWLKRARSAYVDLQRAQNAHDGPAQAEAAKRIEAMWARESEPVLLLLAAASSGPRDAEVTYQLGLCKQEQAEQLQSRIDLLARAGLSAPPSDVERCKEKWVDANGWWDRFTSEYGTGGGGPPARQNQARARAMLGDWQGAAATWNDVSGPMAPPEKLASLYQARQAQKHVAPKQ